MVEILRVLVTGGAGFIGHNLVKALISNQHQVNILDIGEGGTVKFTIVDGLEKHRSVAQYNPAATRLRAALASVLDVDADAIDMTVDATNNILYFNHAICRYVVCI